MLLFLFCSVLSFFFLKSRVHFIDFKHILVPSVGRVLQAFAIPYRETSNSHTFTSMDSYCIPCLLYKVAKLGCN